MISGRLRDARRKSAEWRSTRVAVEQGDETLGLRLCIADEGLADLVVQESGVRAGA
jgi:hypothetical protein